MAPMEGFRLPATHSAEVPLLFVRLNFPRDLRGVESVGGVGRACD